MYFSKNREYLNGIERMTLQYVFRSKIALRQKCDGVSLHQRRPLAYYYKILKTFAMEEEKI
jgi:hypothetical protein